jgi:hypothetical protein
VIRFCAVCLGALALAAPASAEPVTEQVSSGVVTAEFTYDHTGQDYSGFHLKVERDGVTLVDGDVGPVCPDEPCGVVPAGIAAKQDSVRLRDLDADREPEVIVDLFTGGAHCCAFSTIYTFEEGTGKYARLRHNWRDAGYRIQDVGHDGTLELRTRDARFGYVFSSYAESYMPIRYFRFGEGRLEDVTRHYRRWLRADARKALRLYRRVRDRDVNVGGILAAYAADRYRLGQRSAARKTLLRAERRGDVDSAYIKRLDRFLKRIGYTGR